MRKSRRLSSAIRAETSTIASRPKAVPAISAIFCATGSCLPSSWPHCRRSRAHWRTIFREYLVVPAQIAGIGFREQEGGDVVSGHLRQPLALLLLAAISLQRLGQADRLVRGEQGGDGGVPGTGEGQRAVVIELGEAEAAVFLRDLHAQRA